MWAGRTLLLGLTDHLGSSPSLVNYQMLCDLGHVRELLFFHLLTCKMWVIIVTYTKGPLRRPKELSETLRTLPDTLADPCGLRLSQPACPSVSKTSDSYLPDPFPL